MSGTVTRRASPGGPPAFATPAARVARAASRALAAQRPAVLVTLVEVEGSAYLRPGALLLVAPDGRLVGAVSGGCVDEELAARVGAMGAGDAPRWETLDTGADEIEGLGVGCGGVLRFLAEPIGGEGWPAWLDAVARGRPARRRIGPSGTVSWDVEGAPAPLPDVHPHLRSAAGGWLHTVPAPPRLVIVGHGDDAVAIARSAARLGFRVACVGPSRRALEEARRAVAQAGVSLETAVADAGALLRFDADVGVRPYDRVIVASRRLDLDAAGCAWALGHGVEAVRVVGSASRVARLRDRPELAGAETERVCGPAGLRLGARGPEEIAVAVAAEWVGDLDAGRTPLVAVIPAAGRASRMGGDKLLLRLDGETLLARAQRVAEAACDGTIVVLGPDTPAREGELRGGVTVVRLDRGPPALGRSLHAGLEALPSGAAALILLPDMPGVTADHLVGLRAAAVRVGGGAASRHPDGRLGAPVVLPPSWVALLTAEAREGAAWAGADRGLQPWLEARRNLGVVDLRDARDLDRPAQAAEAGATWLAPPRGCA